MGKGFYLPEDGHIAMLWAPGDDLDGGDTHSLVMNMENWEHCTFIILYGTAPRAAGVVTVESCSALGASPGTATKIPFSYRKCIIDGTTAGTGDVLGDRVDVTVAATGLIPEAGTPNNIMYVIDLNSDQLVSGHVGFRLDLVSAGAACLAAGIAILSGPRYASKVTATVTA
jgi:hypothetical protein